jgi:ankyrin repeat protein
VFVRHVDKGSASMASHSHGHGHDDDVDPGTPYDQSLEELDFLRSACAAAQRGQLSKLEGLLSRKPDCVHWDGVTGNSGYTPLHYAAREGHLACVKLLLHRGERAEVCGCC